MLLLCVSLVRIALLFVVPIIGVVIASFSAPLIFSNRGSLSIYSLYLARFETYASFALLVVAMFGVKPNCFMQNHAQKIDQHFAQLGLDLNRGLLSLGLHFSFQTWDGGLLVLTIEKWIALPIYVFSNPGPWLSNDLFHPLYFAIVACYVTTGVLLQNYCLAQQSGINRLREIARAGEA
jgi:hypothetical protein